MTWQNYELENTILKATEALTLWKIEKGIVEIDKNTLAIPIRLDDERKGYVFHGHGKLILDTIVETEKGAVGKPVEKEINEPFLMLGKTEETEQRLSTADKEDLKMMSYESEQDFSAKAEALFDRFLGKRILHGHHCCGHIGGFVFAFPNKDGKLDVLIAEGSKLVYKAMDKVFVSNKSKIVLKTPNEVIISNDRRSLVFKC
jgi:hypothetical protein